MIEDVKRDVSPIRGVGSANTGWEKIWRLLEICAKIGNPWIYSMYNKITNSTNQRCLCMLTDFQVCPARFIEALRQFMKRRIQWKEWFPLSSLMGACLISACQVQVEKEQEIIVRGNLKSKRRWRAKNFVGFHPPCLLSPPLVSVWPPPKLSVCTLHRLHNCASTIHQTFGQTKLMTGRLK